MQQPEPCAFQIPHAWNSLQEDLILRDGPEVPGNEVGMAQWSKPTLAKPTLAIVIRPTLAKTDQS